MEKEGACTSEQKIMCKI